MKTITLRDANQGFARCVREVEAGEEFVITRNGKPVARLAPVSGRRVLTAEQEAALARTKARRNLLIPDAAEPFVVKPLDRDALHER